MTQLRVGTHEEWDTARARLLKREKELTRMSDEVARQRRQLPLVRVTERYTFQTEDGPKKLAELFDGRSQLVFYHFMFGPDYEAGCTTCASIADSFSGVVAHLKARDVTMVCVSSAPLEKLLRYKRTMGWSFPWASAYGTKFNVDLGFSSSVKQTRSWVEPMLDGLPPIAGKNASESGTDVVRYLTESQGFSTFLTDGDSVYHFYSTGARGVEFLMGYYPILDRTPKGRQEDGAFQTWLQPHNQYNFERHAEIRP